MGALTLDRTLYAWLDGFAPALIAWTALFTLITTARIALKVKKGLERLPHDSVLTELAALPLVILQSVCFVRAARSRDAVSALLFLWWGPGFIATVLYVASCALRRRKPDFHPYRHVISWLCKLNYLAFAAVFIALKLPALLLVYSAWIINDQYGMAFLSLDADRLRRTFHDRWLVRLLYPLGLFVPFAVPAMDHARAYQAFGGLLFLLWALGIRHIARRGDVMQVPTDSSLWRNMVYFAKPGP